MEQKQPANADFPLLRLVELTRRFPGVLALDAVSFDLAAGEVHALVGENGAGKSTLINIVSGVLQPDGGSVRLAGEPVVLASPPHARKLGILAVHQEAELFPTLSVAENLALETGLPTRAGGWVDWPRTTADARAAVELAGSVIDVRQPAARLSVAQRHLVQIAAAIHRRPKVLVLDEPTASLSAEEARWLFGHVRRLKQAGCGVIYVSHRQHEIFELADRITVLRDGRRVWSGPTTEIDCAGLLRAMVGREQAPRAAKVLRATSSDTPALKVSNLCDPAGKLHDVRLHVQAGEVVGLYGLVGAGRSELARAIVGLDAVSKGLVEVGGVRLASRRPQAALQAGVAYLPEDRLREGLCRGLSLRANATLSSLKRMASGPWVSATAERAATSQMVVSLGVRCRSVEQPVGQLSGGNQQKVVLARALLTEPKVLVLDEPTRGVDIGSKAEIHAILRKLADRGVGVLLISSELAEVLEHSDRVLTFREGSVSAQFDPTNTSPEQVAAAALPEPVARATRDVGRPALKSRSQTRLGEGDSAILLRGLRKIGTVPGGFATGSRRLGNELMLGVAVALLFAALAFGSGSFGSRENLLGVLAKTSVPLILALAAASVIVAGAIDVSLGSLVALAAAVGGLVMKLPVPPALAVPFGIAAGLGVGMAGGTLNAALSLAGRMHPIVVTLGTMTIYRGLLITITGGQAVADLPPQFGSLATGAWFGLDGRLLIALVVAAAAYAWLEHTRSGRHLYAIGASPTAAQLVGISHSRTWLAAFAAGGTLAGLGGMLELAEAESMQSTMGTQYELHAITAAVLGGFSISGGRGRVLGVVLASLLLALADNARVQWQISAFQSELVTGSLLLAAVLIDRFGRSRDA